MAIDSDISAPVPLAELECQPTPPPRKKKLQKKLELLEPKLNEEAVEGPHLNSRDSVETVSGVKEKEVVSENTCSDISDDKLPTVSVGENSNELGLREDKESPKKSRRRKKHLQ